MRCRGIGKDGTIWLGRACSVVIALCVLGVCPIRADGVCADPDPVYLDSDAQCSLCETSLVPQTSGGSDASFVMTARSSVDESAPTDPDASGSPGTVQTSDKGAGVKTADCKGSKGISGGGGHKDEELIFTYSDGLAVDCVIVGLADIKVSCSNDRPPLSADAGQDQTTFEAGLVTLDSTGSDAPEEVTLSYTWTQTAGPLVTLSDSNVPQPTFAAPLVTGPTPLEFQVEVSDGISSSTASTLVTVNVPDPTNSPPVADAGLDQTADAFSAVLLDASATLDSDGNPMTFRWEQVAGPAVILLDANTAQARFLAPEVQGLTELIFRVAVTDGQADSTSTTRATVSCTNDEPVIFIRSAGSPVYDYTVSTAQIAAVFNPTTTDHGTVAFDDFTFLPAGLVIDAFKIRETADHIYVEFIDCACPCLSDPDCDDGDVCNGVEVCDPTEGCLPGTEPVNARVTAGADDAEEQHGNGSMYLTSTDLELGDGDSNDAEGMRFTNIGIPQGAPVTEAYIEFKVDEATSAATNLTFRGEDVDNAATFTSAAFNITGRAPTTASVAWNVPAWNTVGAKHQTPNLASIIQEIVDRPGWSSGNAIVITVTGTGSRVAESVNGDAAGAPLLHVEYGGTALDCDDGDPCNGIETCDPSSGCVAGTNLPPGTSCDEGDVCNGDATCDADGQCQPGTPLECDDGNECNGVETCDPVDGCQPGIPLLCPPLDVVFVMDTSGSMQNEGETLCTIINDVVADLSSMGVSVNDRILAIHPNYTSNLFSCQSPSDTVHALLGDAVPGDPDGCPGDLSGNSSSEKDENWGPATAIVADRYPWTPGATRVIVPISDEGACLGSSGNGCNDPGSDRDAVDNAVSVAVANDVVVSPITGDGSSVCVITLAQIMATGTGGTAFNSTEPASDMADAIAALILAACEPTDVCDDDDACTTADACVNDQCVGTPVNCGHLDDQCNAGACNPTTGQCEAVPTPGVACSDGNACTEGDTCDADGLCQGTPVTCDDGNDCTDDACNLTTGCIFTPDDSNACDDGDACTTDACVAGACIGTAVDCSDLDDDCNIGVCNPGTGACEAQFANEGGACTDDGNECTSDVCKSGVCIHPSLADNTPCTDDGIGCTIDKCKAGSCAHGPDHAVCDDNEDCTDDTCDPVNGDPVTGCLYTPDDTNTCTDGDNCTDDACVAGSCVSTAVNCSSLNDDCNVGVCNPGTGACEPQAANEGGACTDDGNECTNDVCEAGVCTHPAVLTPAACTDDGIGCTVDECIAGACTHTPNDGACDDSESCTDDTCDPASGDPVTGCLFTPDDANACSDGDNCTTDACVAGSCENTAVDCSGLNDDCNLGVCNPGTGDCEAQPTNEGGACTDDGNECTTDICQAGSCVHPAVADGSSCTDDGNDCTDDVCVAAACTHPNVADGTSCTDDGVVCTVDQCAAGVCIHTPSDAICNDNSVCTIDTCFPVTGCAYADVADCCTSDAECDDSNACTNDTCNIADGTCSFVTAVDCSHLNDACNIGVCIPATGACEASPINEGGTCPDDGNECTGDACQSGVCTHTALADGTSCTADALSCTVDECVGGTCVHTPDHGACNDNESCTDDTCDAASGDPVTGCLFTPDDSNTCTDGDNCTNDACVAGVCSSTAVGCSHLDDACNVGVCNPDTGACEPQHANEGGPCPDDGNECTDDVCQAGVCTHPALVDGTACTDDGVGCTVDECIAGACSHTPDDSVCDDTESCTDDTCDPVNGDPVTGCLFTPDDTNTCTDGDNCTNDACVAGACESTAVDCSHLNDACNVGVCNPGTGACEAQPTNEGGSCPDDGNECTDDRCESGVCTHFAVADGTVCTDDGVGCTVDECIAGACSHTPDDSVCDDSESCTDDTCDPVNGDPVTGCLFTPDDTNNCTDGDDCTNDACVAGACESTAVNCSHLNDACNVGVCNQTTGDCEANATNDGGSCPDDGNDCTDDLCESGICTHPAVADEIACPDDGIDCTVDECIAGQCMHRPDDLACEDQNPCTDDWCDPGQGCQYTPDDDNACELDGNFCTIDTCVNGTCETDTVTCPADDECATYICNPDTGLCDPQPINDGLPCTADQNDCTDDICMFAKCQHPALDDGTPCTDDMDDCTDDLCLNGACSHPDLEDGTPCAEDAFDCSLDVCVEGVCDHLPMDGACDDEEVCTDDTCDLVNGEFGTGCLFTPNDGNTCADGSPCTDDACVNGTCDSEPVDCTHLDDECNVGVCDEQTGECLTEPANEGGPCPDEGVTCTNGVCVSGVCTHQPDHTACDDANPCTDDTCDPAGGDPATGCLFTANDTNTCPDGDPCSDETCLAGDCVITPVDCSHLADDCNEGVCDSGTGDCFRRPAFEGASCDDDDNECTSDTCVNGTCEHVDNGLCQSCCLPDASCVELTSDTCLAQGGTPVGLRAMCGTDGDGDGVDDLCDACPGVDDAVFAPCPPIPTVSQWGLVVLVLLLLVVGKIYFGGVTPEAGVMRTLGESSIARA